MVTMPLTKNEAIKKKKGEKNERREKPSYSVSASRCRAARNGSPDRKIWVLHYADFRRPSNREGPGLSGIVETSPAGNNAGGD